MTIGELMRELDAERNVANEAPSVFTLWHYSPAGQYRAQIDSDARGTLRAHGRGYEGATAALVTKMLHVSGQACARCGNQHLSTAMIEVDWQGGRMVCKSCADAINDTTEEEANQDD